MSLPAELKAQLADAGLNPAWVEDLVRAALEEDGQLDITSVATVPEDQHATADVVTRMDGVVAGLPVFAVVLHAVGREGIRFDQLVGDGARIRGGDVVATAYGRTRDLLQAERTALNLLTHLSGIATVTRQWVDAVEGTGAQIRDTRKTLPLLRALEKYAVRCGGGTNHRMSLEDAALIKDNHVVAAGGVAKAFRLVRDQFAGIPVEIEVDDVAGALEAVEAGADLVLLDNFTTAQTREAVVAVGGRARLESSGGLTLERAYEVAATGVDYLAVGALTHSSPTLDLALDLREVHG